MKRSKRFLSLVLAALMIVSLTACTKRTDNSNVTPTTAPTNAPTNTPSADGPGQTAENHTTEEKKQMFQKSTPNDVYQTSDNLAYGAKATANEIETDYFTAECAVDGIVNRGIDSTQQSRWSTNRGTNAKILTLDLWEEKTFNKFVIEWERDNIINYSVRISDDGKNFKPIYEKKGQEPRYRKNR